MNLGRSEPGEPVQASASRRQPAREWWGIKQRSAEKACGGMLLWDVVFGAQERCGWEGKGAVAGGARGCLRAVQSAPSSAARALQGTGIPAELFLLPRLWSRMALVQMPGFPR